MVMGRRLEMSSKRPEPVDCASTTPGIVTVVFAVVVAVVDMMDRGGEDR